MLIDIASRSRHIDRAAAVIRIIGTAQWGHGVCAPFLHCGYGKHSVKHSRNDVSLVTSKRKPRTSKTLALLIRQAGQRVERIFVVAGIDGLPMTSRGWRFSICLRIRSKDVSSCRLSRSRPAFIAEATLTTLFLAA